MISFLFVVCTMFIAALCTTTGNHINWLFEENTQQDLEIELLKKLELEKVKARILKEFGLDEPPTFASPMMRLSTDVIEMLLRDAEYEPYVQQKSTLANIVILPTNSDFQCRWYNITTCRRFEYNIQRDVILPTAELWVYKLDLTWPSENITISISYSHSNRRNIIEHKEFSLERSDLEWIYFDLSVFKNLKLWKKDTRCAIEITGIVIDEQKPNLPFLKMTKDVEILTRKKKDDVSTVRNNNCNTVPLNISFEALGFGGWIIHPHSYQANVCEGYCQHVKNHHENFVDMMFQRNSTLETKYGRCWATCCRPKEYGTLRMIYREEENTYADRNMTNMIVLSCSCN